MSQQINHTLFHCHPNQNIFVTCDMTCDRLSKTPKRFHLNQLWNWNFIYTYILHKRRNTSKKVSMQFSLSLNSSNQQYIIYAIQYFSAGCETDVRKTKTKTLKIKRKENTQKKRITKSGYKSSSENFPLSSTTNKKKMKILQHNKSLSV